MTKETYLMMEELVNSKLTQLETEEDLKKQEMLTKEICELNDRMLAYDSLILENEDKEKRRIMEEERNNRTEELDRQKIKVDKLKVGATIGLGVVGFVKFVVKGIRLNKMFGFEKTGTYTSKAGREVIQDCMRDDE